MESNRTNIENHQYMVWSTSDGQEIGEVRLYKCTFCERGFSNAQALGGHMNIHRKDRAKLKEFGELEIPTVTVRDSHRSSHQLPSPDYRNFLQSVSSEHIIKSDQERKWTQKSPLIFAEEGDQESSRITAAGINKQVMQLPLFVERSSRSSIFVDEDVEKTKTLELDLELRLGPEPHA